MLKRELNAKEVKKLEELQTASGTVVQPSEMPTADFLLDKKIQVLMHGTKLNNRRVLD